MFTALSRFQAASTFLLFAMAGCASAPTIEKLYHDPAAASAPYERLLIVGIAGDAGQRQVIEDLIVAELADESLAGIAAHTRLGTSPVVLQEAIDDAAATTQSDAILIAHQVSAKVSPEFREGRTEIRSECRGGNPVDFFLYDHKELREPDSVTLAHEVTMVTNLYDARSGKRVWTIQSTCFDKSEFQTVLRQEAEAIVRQLRRDGLVTHPKG